MDKKKKTVLLGWAAHTRTATIHALMHTHTYCVTQAAQKACLCIGVCDAYAVTLDNPSYVGWPPVNSHSSIKCTAEVTRRQEMHQMLCTDISLWKQPTLVCQNLSVMGGKKGNWRRHDNPAKRERSLWWLELFVWFLVSASVCSPSGMMS